MARLHQLFSTAELQALDAKELEILKDAVRDAIAGAPEIQAILKARAQQVYAQLRPGYTPKS